MHSMIWRRLDPPGHDACRLDRIAAGWSIAGAAVFLCDGKAARLGYRVVCNPEWRTLSGEVEGWIGNRSVRLVIERSTDGQWTLDGSLVEGVASLMDLDLGFTPATNVIAIRRLNLKPGRVADAPAAWLDVTDWTLKPLEQRYRRLPGDAYAYEAPAFGYAANLEVSPEGLVTRYPGLWEAEQPALAAG